MASKEQDVTLQVLVPENAKPGDKLKVKMPDGSDAVISIPAGSRPSSRISVKVKSSVSKGGNEDKGEGESKGQADSECDGQDDNDGKMIPR